MRFLDALKPQQRAASGWSQDLSLNWLAQEWLKFQGQTYPGGYQTTYANEKAEPISDDLVGMAAQALGANGVVSAIEQVRFKVFAEARFQWQRLTNGRPGDLFGSQDLSLLERPWEGGTTGDLLSRMLLDADLAGNSYTARIDGELVRLRPDWVQIALAPREIHGIGPNGETLVVGSKRAGYLYFEGGPRESKVPAVFLPNEVAHFAPYPDPLYSYRGMSWLTPVIREIQSDQLATKHKLKFFENAATPNLAVSLPKEISAEAFSAFVDKMESSHKGADNAYKTLYTGGGADVTVIGANMQQLDFKTTQGAGETRLAAAGRVPAVLVGLSEGLQGSSLNAGNYQAAKRSFADGEMRSLWRNAAGSLEVLVPPPTGARLWYDDRDIAFLREDQKDAAEIQNKRSMTIRQLTDAGFEPSSVIAAVNADDFSLLKHSGLYSVQLQAPGTTNPAAPAA